MSPIYLRKVSLREFRTFGKAEFNIAAGPSVLIVCGTNGLGKSSLFDAIEWGLTGAVNRYASIKAEQSETVLRRWDADENTRTRVYLQFDTGLEVTREFRDGQVSARGLRNLTEALKSDAWRGEITDIQSFLALTHFLGQSATSKITAVESGERWRLLQGPAQSNWADEIGRALHGTGNTTIARAYKKAELDILEDVQSLERLISSVSSQATLDRVEGKISENDAVTALLALVQNIDRASRRLRATPQAGFMESSTEILGKMASADEVLQIAATDVSDLRAAIERRRSDIQDGRNAVKRLGELRNEVGQIALEIERVEALKVAVDADMTATLQSIEDLDRRADAHRRKKLEFDMRVSTLQSLKQSQADNAERSAKIESMRATLTRELTREEGLLSKKRRLDRCVKVLDRIETESRKATETIGVSKERITQVKAAQFALKACDQSRDIVEKFLVNFPNVENDIEEKSKVVADCEAAVEAAQVALNMAKEVVGDLSAAVSSIAGHIHSDTGACPVCASLFPPGELEKQVRAAADRMAPTLRPFEEKLRVEKEALVHAQEKLGEANSVKRHLDNQRDQLQKAEAEVVRYAVSLGIDMSAAALDREVRELEEAIEHSKQDQQRVSWLKAKRAFSSLAEAFGQREKLSGELSQVSVGLAGLRSQIQSMQEAAGRSDRNDAEAWGALDLEPLTPDALEAEEEAATIGAHNEQAALNAMSSEAQRARARHAEFQRISVEHEGTLKNRRDRRKGLLEEQGILQRKLITAFSLDDVQELDLDESDGVLKAVELEAGQISEQIEVIRVGHAAWLRESTERKALEGLEGALGIPAGTMSLAEVVALAKADQDKKLNYARRIRLAANLAKAASKAIQEQVQDFNNEYLRPLNELMNKFNRAILMRDIGIGLFAEKKRIEQFPQVAGAPEYIEEVDPRAVHSEGEMAALSISMLCAASSTFNWSRWPALIMDDPLQHNDVVHVAAFADMMSNFILDRKYQLFLSTHDVGQAEYLKRKFSAANISCAVVTLAGHGSGGTVPIWESA